MIETIITGEYTAHCGWDSVSLLLFPVSEDCSWNLPAVHTNAYRIYDGLCRQTHTLESSWKERLLPVWLNDLCDDCFAASSEPPSCQRCGTNHLPFLKNSPRLCYVCRARMPPAFFEPGNNSRYRKIFDECQGTRDWIERNWRTECLLKWQQDTCWKSFTDASGDSGERDAKQFCTATNGALCFRLLFTSIYETSSIATAFQGLCWPVAGNTMYRFCGCQMGTVTTCDDRYSQNPPFSFSQMRIVNFSADFIMSTDAAGDRFLTVSNNGDSSVPRFSVKKRKC